MGSKSQLPTPHAAPAELVRCYGEGAKSPLFALKCINVNNLPVTFAGLFRMVVNTSRGELSLPQLFGLGCFREERAGRNPAKECDFSEKIP